MKTLSFNTGLLNTFSTFAPEIWKNTTALSRFSGTVGLDNYRSSHEYLIAFPGLIFRFEIRASFRLTIYSSSSFLPPCVIEILSSLCLFFLVVINLALLNSGSSGLLVFVGSSQVQSILDVYLLKISLVGYRRSFGWLHRVLTNQKRCNVFISCINSYHATLQNGSPVVILFNVAVLLNKIWITIVYSDIK